MTLEAVQDEMADDIAALLDASGVMLPDPEHATRCAAFAKMLFRDLQATLGLEPSHERLAVAAALFHDIGYLRGTREHHRRSFEIVRSLPLPGFTERERVIAACAARYHGHSLPNIEHAGFGEMTSDDQRAVRRISAIVRVAAALDGSHMGAINDIELHVSGSAVFLTAVAEHEPAVERDRLRESGGGFTALTQVPMQTDVRVTGGYA